MKYRNRERWNWMNREKWSSKGEEIENLGRLQDWKNEET